jgi:molybdopterin synthase catalytic subunit
VAFLSTQPVDLESLHRSVQSPARGGVASFVGIVRDHHAGRRVVRLEYSAYGPMAEAECGRIVAHAESRWSVAVRLRHRVGALEVGDLALVVIAASAHREEAFAACRYVVEEVKRRVPVWKHEFYADGGVEWVDPSASMQPVPVESVR